MTTGVSVKGTLGRGSTSLDDRLGPRRAAGLRASLAAAPFRRLRDDPENVIDVSRLCQMVHVDLHARKRTLVLGDELTPYYVDSLDSSLREIQELLDLGIRRVYLQAVPSAPAGPDVQGILDAMVTTVAAVRDEFHGAVELVVDPQVLCMRPDLRWGLSGPHGEVDAESTLVLLGDAIEEFARLGVHGVMTIGRINGEAEVARAALAAVGGRTRLYAFSTNSETPTAYFDRTEGDPRRAITGQKILVGNGEEMILRALGDMAEGVDGVLQKPLENVHVLSVLASLIDGRLSLERYLSSPPVAQFLEADPGIADRCAHIAPQNLREVQVGKVSLGAYEVSGTFSSRVLLRQKFGEAIAWSVAQEAYLTALAAAGRSLEMIVGRGMRSFVTTGRRLELM